ncbi:hypothetical protein TrLO_g15271 [Triparma laevis f. longispina]|uniref:Kinesin motor domain-containing protein n=1 Tax=Triparma laevis f. longispina TaxID=1714387 RepID=A0A9W7KSJ6_9STRA|nr:hypothetical protein TrLO_g15271 [Triparma laevis f. longispina]
MSVSIKVAIRCRPFVKEDKLGVEMTQNSEEEGEVQLLNSDYTTNRFAFTYSWWTAFNYERYVQSDEAICKRMKFVGQEDVYNSVGQKIKADLMDGNPVVLFAYGLSGSGKTFTVFGPDAADSPDAWFKHDKPHPQWGVFPHLAYDMFNEKQDGWKFTMKYFQNVVDIVRDLMSPMVKEQSYKSGMRKDKDGFMDIEWCEGTVLKTWDDLREQFQKSNEKKAISPTQFNHQSTRGHCIMTLEVEMPMVDNPSLKQKGRVYVCDLAGTEPAGDIFYALYEKKTFPNGDVEHILKGPHKDQRKTKELQDQGKKINLSLSEMAQFFMKMAEAVKKKTLKPGKSIPGCNSYFLCKYLKDTMLQARTYLFCAIRPEVQFLNYTFATLGFAKNASVIKLAPKKATVEASAGELKLMAELAELKALVAELQSGDGAGSEDIAALLAQKQAALANQLAGGDAGSAKSNNEAEMKQQAEEYGRRGISLSHFEKGTKEPYFVNLDEDPFRSNRFMYLLTKDVTVFGPGGDIKPLALSVVKGHCSVERHENDKTEITEAFTNCTLVGGAGETIHNGKKLDKDARIALKPFDRVAIGGELLLYRHPEFDPKDQEPMSASNAIEEYQKSLAEADNEQKRQMDERMKAFEAEKDEWRKQQGLVKTQEEQDAIENAKAKEEHDRAMAAVDREILELLPKTKELKKIVGLLDRDQLSFDVTLQRTDDPLGVPTVKVKVINGLTDESIIIDPFEFIKSYSIVKDETSRLSMAIESGREYEVSELNDPLKILFDNTFQLGTCTIFPEYLIYGLSTDEDEVNTDIKNCSAPYNNVGKLEVTWVPLETPDSEEDPDYAPDIDDDIGPADLLGKPWTYKIKISSCSALPITVDECYVQYTFNGVEYTTETLNEQDTHNPAFEYTCVHHVESVDQEFLDYLMTPLEINLYCSPAVRQPKTKVSTTNSAVVKNLTAGVMVAEGGGASRGGGGGGDAELERLRARVAELETENARLIQENEKLKAGGSAVVKGLEAAKALDTSINA